MRGEVGDERDFLAEFEITNVARKSLLDMALDVSREGSILFNEATAKMAHVLHFLFRMLGGKMLDEVEIARKLLLAHVAVKAVKLPSGLSFIPHRASFLLNLNLNRFLRILFLYSGFICFALVVIGELLDNVKLALVWLRDIGLSRDFP